MTKSYVSRVIENGYCVGCGVCAAASDGKLKMKLTDNGTYEPATADVIPSSLDDLCPFSNQAPNESEHGERLFADAPASNPYLGRYIATYAGHALDEDYRERGSSGGLTSWILARLLEEGKVDHVVHVAPRDIERTSGPLFYYDISDNVAGIRQRSKSRYYPVELSGAIRIMREKPGRYAFVGVPCFVKAVRNLALQDSLIKSRVHYTIALFCGHLKSAGFAESLSWQLGVPPDDIAEVDFRHKMENRPANAYGFRTTSRQSGKSTAKPMSELVGRDWGMGLLKLKACDFCDDVAGETADVSLGDAWLPGYVNDSKGTNLIVTRNRDIDELIRNGIDSGRLNVGTISPDDAIRSQASGYKHRRQGLQYRLYRADARGKWRPTKRVEALSTHLSFGEKMVFAAREILRDESHRLFAKARKTGVLLDYIRPVSRRIFVYRVVKKLASYLRR